MPFLPVEFPDDGFELCEVWPVGGVFSPATPDDVLPDYLMTFNLMTFYLLSFLMMVLSCVKSGLSEGSSAQHRLMTFNLST